MKRIYTARNSYRRHNVASLQKNQQFCTDDVYIVYTTLRINNFNRRSALRLYNPTHKS